MNEYEKAKFDEAQQAVLGTLMDGCGAPGERIRNAQAVIDAGGLKLFDDEWSCEMWRRVEAAMKDFKDPCRYRHIKQVEDLPPHFVEEVISKGGVTGMLLEQVYLPELVESARKRAVSRALKEAAESGDTGRLEALLKQSAVMPGDRTTGTVCNEVITEWEKAAEHPGELTGIASGLWDVDKLTWGWQRQNLIIIGARPSHGKTAIMIGFALHAAVKLRVPTVFFSLESSDKEIVRRMACQLSGADQSRLRGGMANVDDVSRLPSAMSQITKAPLKIVDCPGASISWIRSEARKYKETMGARFFCVDYLQKIKPHTRNEKKTYEVAQASEGLKEMAIELDCPVVTAAQLNREPEKSGNKGKPRPPRLSDLSDCGQIERDADIVGLLQRIEGQNWLVLAKFRDGPTDSVQLAFTKHCARFDNLSRIEECDIPERNPHND